MGFLARREPDYLDLARAHRRLQGVALGVFAVVVVVPAGMLLLAPLALVPLLLRGWAYAFLASLAVLGAQTLRVAWHCGVSGLWLGIAALGLCVPLINVGVVIGYDNLAARLIREAGARVGFLGTGMGELPRIAAGRCVTCDYDLSALGARTVCPECGHDNSVSAPRTPAEPPLPS